MHRISRPYLANNCNKLRFSDLCQYKGHQKWSFPDALGQGGSVGEGMNLEFGWIGTWRIHTDPGLLYAWQTFAKIEGFSIWPPIQFLDICKYRAGAFIEIPTKFHKITYLFCWFIVAQYCFLTPLQELSFHNWWQLWKKWLLGT